MITPLRVFRSLMKRARRTQDDVKTSFYLPRATLRALKARAVAEGRSLRVVLLDAVNAHVGRHSTREG